MNDNAMHPYTLDVRASERKPGLFDWSIRRNGTLIQRSDRIHRTEEDARASGTKAVEKQIEGSRKER